MDAHELNSLLDTLIHHGESRTVEFKEAKNQFDIDKLGKYVSALANEANLADQDAAWMVFGVDDHKHAVGSNIFHTKEAKNKIEYQIQQGIDQNLTIRNSYEIIRDNKRVVLLEIPSSPRGLPTSWKGIYYARSGESLTPLPDNKRDEIRSQTFFRDWTAEIVHDATLNHLSQEALIKARAGFKRRPGNRLPESEIDGWDDWTFLAKADLLRNNQLTRAALLLLGNQEGRHALNPHMAEITWRLETEEQAYEHFHPPFLLTITEMTQRIRNVNVRILPKGELIYREVSKYDERTLLEATYNCLAHQDYHRNARIVVTEFIDRVEFINVGDFYDGKPEQYVLESRTPHNYRNPFLAHAMTMLNLIDHMGYGIKRMYQDQVKRYFPLPDFDFSRHGEVKLTIPGAVIDQAYSQTLIANTDLAIQDIIALDRVQKGFGIDDTTVRRLRRKNLIEGRRPNLQVSQVVATASGEVGKYVRYRPFHNKHYEQLILEFISANKGASRKEIDDLLLPILSDALDPKQKHQKISNLIASLRRRGQIENVGVRTSPKWVAR